MADLLMEGEAAVRAAEALLRGTGGRAVLLRLPVPATAGDEAEQLGLTTPDFQDVELTPCAFRKAGDRRELLLSALAVKQVVGTLEFDSAKVLFGTALGLVVDAELLEIVSIEAVEQMGTAVCYRLKLRRA